MAQQGAWLGLGELHLFARDAGSPVFAKRVRLLAERGLVLLIHGDVEVIDRVFALAPEVRVLWADLGTFPVLGLLDAMLEKHGERLWIDTSVRDERIAPEGVLLARRAAVRRSCRQPTLRPRAGQERVEAPVMPAVSTRRMASSMPMLSGRTRCRGTSTA